MTTQQQKRTRIISVGGGKGGVGKSIVSCNLAVAMAQLGHKTVLADLDLGAANQHLLLGIDRPLPGIEALLSRGNEDVRESLTPTRTPNLQLLAGTGVAILLICTLSALVSLMKVVRLEPAIVFKG